MKDLNKPMRKSAPSPLAPADAAELDNAVMTALNTAVPAEDPLATLTPEQRAAVNAMLAKASAAKTAAPVGNMLPPGWAGPVAAGTYSIGGTSVPLPACSRVDVAKMDVAWPWIGKTNVGSLPIARDDRAVRIYPDGSGYVLARYRDPKHGPTVKVFAYSIGYFRNGGEQYALPN